MLFSTKNTVLMIIICGFLSTCATGPSMQIDSLRLKISKIVAKKNADVGVAVYGFDQKDEFDLNGSNHYPMQSVFKFHIALTILKEVDNGNLTLEQKIHISQNDLVINTWSPLAKEYPAGNIDLPLSTILSYTVSQSDNNGCDILLKLIGGVEKVNAFIHSLGVEDVSIKANEQSMQKTWDVQFENWTTPLAANKLLRMFFEEDVLSKKSSRYLLQLLTETSTGKTRLKGQLPSEAIVAHKTGTSGRNDRMIRAATNDIGIITLPTGKHYAISVFVTNSIEDDEINDKIIADISKAVWDYYIAKTK